MTVSDLFDQVVAILSPERGLRRHYARQLLRRSNVYAAAKTNRLTGNWTTVSPNVNDIIGASSPAVRARVRQLVRDFPYFARAVNNLVDYTVGPGIMYQSRVTNPDGTTDTKHVREIEDAWHWWCDEADAAGKLHYYEMMRLAKRQDVEVGEFLIVKTLIKDPSRYLPYALQIYEADWLTTSHDTYTGAAGVDVTAGAGEKQVCQGVEYEKRTGRVTGYWFRDPHNSGREVRISADNVIHGFDTLRPQQMRGISPLAPGVLVAHDLSDYMDAEIDGAKFAAKYLAFVKKENPAGMGYPGLEQTTEGTDKRIENLENAIIEYLNPREDIVIAKHDRPGNTFDPFVRLILTMLSITSGVPYELLSGDYRGLNFSTARIVRNDFQQQLRPIAARHIRQYGMATFRTFLDWAVLTGKINLPGYIQNPRRYLECEWQPPGMEAVDPLREAKGQIDAIAYGLKSPQEVARARGRDLEEIYREIKDAQELAKEYGLEFSQPGTALANNPAAIEQED